MAQPTNNQNQNNQGGKNDQKKSDGGGPRVYISPPKEGKPIITIVQPATASSKGKYQAHVRLGQSVDEPKAAVLVQLYANDSPIGDVLHIREEDTHDIDFQEPESRLPIVISVKRAGYPKDEPWGSLPPVTITPKAKEEEPAPPPNKRMKISVGRLTAGLKNPVNVYTFDENGKKENSAVIIELGQEGFVDTKHLTGADLTHKIETGKAPFEEGHGACLIQLLECDNQVLFCHESSGETELVTLLKEP